MTDREERARIARAQCERVARIYHHFRMQGGTFNDIVEIPAMKRLIGEVVGKRILDAGCGFGTYSIHCAVQGARVTGIDVSPTMIELAREEAKMTGVEVDFRVVDGTDMEGIDDRSFDMVISSIAFSFDVPSFFQSASRVLKPGGVLCYSECHPLLGAGYRTGDGKEAVRTLEHYFDRGIRTVKNAFGKVNPEDEDYPWQWEHRTLGDFSEALRDAGFLIETLLEPEPEPGTRHLNPERYDQASKYPIFFLVRAIKPIGQFDADP
jgi:2-polyprenyl-3-methyl-5-hydroxy-6-metoxy-1,4-benzoquinol methylase